MWLLLLALPLQGWAAASMLNCGPSHHRMAGATAPAAVHEGHHQGAAAHHHGDAGPGEVDSTAGAPTAAGELGSHHDLTQLGKFKCSACAVCSTAAALPVTVLAFEAAPSTGFVAPPLPDATVVFQTGGPERPPRSFLA